MIAGTGALDAAAGGRPPGDGVLMSLGALVAALSLGLLAGRSFAMAAVACLVLLVTFIAYAFNIIWAANGRGSALDWAIALVASGAGLIPAAWLAVGLATERRWF